MSSFPYRCCVLAIALVCTMTGCRKSKHHCPGAPLDNCNHIDASTACTSNDDCSKPEGVCDAGGSMACVQCVAPDQTSACTGTTPACGDDHSCRGCTSHAECSGSDACLPDGSCADPGQVAYVQQGGTGVPPCARGAPCGTLQQGVDSIRPHIKVATGVLVGTDTTTIDGRSVTILAAPGAKLDRTGDGRILLVRSAGANVSIYDLEITGQTGLTDEAIQLEPNGGAPTLSLVRVKVTGSQGRGIAATGGTLTVLQSTISGNTGGGISAMDGTFVIVGNVFFNNGNDTGFVGGVSLGTPQNAMNRLEFNSFNRNKAQDTLGTAIHCIAGTFTARNNIMSQNGTMTNMEQISGTCSHTYSIVRPGTLPSGTGNSSADPQFANTTIGDLHLRAGSPARGAADPSSNLTGPAGRDIDGDTRTAPADLGADEVP